LIVTSFGTGRPRARAPQPAARSRHSDPAVVILLLFKVVIEVIDPVMGSFQVSRIKRQTPTIDAANFCMMSLFLGIHPTIGRVQLRNVGRQTPEKVVRWNDRLWIIFAND